MKGDLPAPRDGNDLKVLKDVEESGCHIVVLPAVQGRPALAYSIGLYHNYDHPEILVCGLRPGTMQNLITCICADIQRGNPFPAGSRHSEIIAMFDCEFRAVDRSHYPAILGNARWFYGTGDEFPVLQCLWPDKAGLYPWEAEFNPKLAEIQPNYYEARMEAA